MDEPPFTTEEIRQLQQRLPLLEEVRTEATYRAARRLVLGTWKAIILTIAGVILALAAIRTAAIDILHKATQ